MATELRVIDVNRHIDWRLRLSLLVTVIWVLLGFAYISSVVGWAHFATQAAPALGSFLEGAFAPLAFLWLVVGFFIQQSQLSQNTRVIEQQLEAMRHTASQAEVQARAILADELHSRQDTFLRVAEMVREQLGVIGGMLVTSWEGELPAAEDRTFEELWVKLSAGDQSAFSLRIIDILYRRTADPRELFYGTEIRTRHTTNFRRSFERLMERAKACDPEDMIGAALRDSLNGRIYVFMKEADPRAARSS